ncbi:heme biosynthesis protein HemY [Profundibacterium mesophilum]|uniref:DNA repair protein radA n=1 Tax=Profundibacterium mesophilum KAUST100406-0324 TaxID=1037889 RepID=A0A921TFB4_9RHOB|nr:heme biosynthesis HemY N-terminal domain-containing protein [Profundibacterium mesophilum]KAF0676289.1 DNA repair protein radA [Profundibacterium mesophilum KAUST100406-0324]
MLWSLIKIVLFIAVVVALTIGAGYLLETDGAIRVAFGGTEFTLGPLQAAIAAALLVLAVWIVIKILGMLLAVIRFLNGDQTALSRHFARRRESKGYRALADGMLALASGEGRVALSKAEKAEKYLHRPELTNLITAQAAEMVGDKRRAETVYKELLADDRTRFVGVRGLLKHKLDEGDTDTALKLAEKAFALKPKHDETQDILLRLQAGKEDWGGARRTLGAKLKHGTLPRDVYKRRDAVLALSEANEDGGPAMSMAARDHAIEANRLSPDLIPAAVLAAKAYIANNQQRYATRVIKKAWENQPHPDLAAVFAKIEPNETPEARIRRFGTLTRIHPEDPETRMLLAELHIANEDFPAARRALGDLATSHPTARSVTIMAAIERGEGASDAIVRGWLTRALSVSRGPQWVCDNCQNIHSDWSPVCENCGAFDTLSWREPHSGTTVLPGSPEMLPLIVGQVEEQGTVVETDRSHEDTQTASAPSTGGAQGVSASASKAPGSEDPTLAPVPERAPADDTAPIVTPAGPGAPASSDAATTPAQADERKTGVV